MIFGAMMGRRRPNTRFLVKGKVFTPGSSEMLPSCPIYEGRESQFSMQRQG